MGLSPSSPGREDRKVTRCHIYLVGMGEVWGEVGKRQESTEPDHQESLSLACAQSVDGKEF